MIWQHGVRGRDSWHVLWYLLTEPNPFKSILIYIADKEKGKYFKIQANAPAKSAYSVQDVKRRKLEDERTKVAAEEKARQKGRIRRSTLDPLTDEILAREYGNRREGLDGPRIFAKGLVSQGYCLEQYGPPFNVIFAVNERRDLGPSMIDLRTCKLFILFERLGYSGRKPQFLRWSQSLERFERFGSHKGAWHVQIVQFLSTNGMCTDRSIVYEDRLIRIQINADLEGRLEREGMPFDPPFFDEHLGNPGTATSMSIHEGRQRMVVTWMAETPNSGIAIVPIGADLRGRLYSFIQFFILFNLIY